MAIRASHIFPSLLFACVATTTATAAHGAELGDARVASHIGQPLAASVELTMIEDGAAKVGVGLAHPDVYRGANIAMPAVLSSLGLNVTRQGGRQFLHLTTGKPVEGRHLHVYLELQDGGQRSVRLVTLWLTPDPNPAPAPAPALVAPPVPVAVTLPAKPQPASRPAAALHEGEEYVEPRKPVVRRAAVPIKKAIAREVAPVEVPPTATAKRQDTPGTCAPQPEAGQLNACTVLGEKNTALRHELGQLEEKVKVLQATAGAPSAELAPATAPPPAPKGAPRIQLKAKKAPPPEPETPWGLIGGAIAAVLALAGLALALLRRRKRSSLGKIPKEHKPARMPAAATADGVPKPNFMSAVKARLMPGSRKPAAPEPVEPALENSET
ncbi:hypothetical protein [Massilia niabensis]|uniref:FimV N-terminal domain-containing protein n=1 Tax=Massilia niabensis TaxID=544910 RepID=A0ABW0LCJ5_9BURK